MVVSARILVSMGLAALAAPALARPLDVLVQAPNAACALVSDAGNPQFIADDFTVDAPGGWRLTHLTISGAYLFNNVPPASDSFHVEARPNAAGLPGGSPVPGCVFAGLVPTSRTLSARVIGAFNLYDIEIDLPAGCALASGQHFWLVVYEQVVPGDQFAWECGDPAPANGVAGSAFSFDLMTWNSDPSEHSLTVEALAVIFADGFESGNTSAWSATVP